MMQRRSFSPDPRWTDLRHPAAIAIRLGWGLGLVCWSACSTPAESKPGLPSNPDEYFAVVENHPPFLQRLDPPAVGSLSAESCGSCHAAIYDEWKSSLMAEASRDPFVVAKEFQLGKNRPFGCQRCHSHLENQLPALTTGLESVKPFKPSEEMNPAYDERLASEGVTCVVCHMAPEAAFWPESPPERNPDDHAPPIFGARDLQTAPHAVRAGSAFAEPGRLCEMCHRHNDAKQNLIFGSHNPDVVREAALYRERGGTEDCVSCHMGTVYRPTANGGPARAGHDHRFPGVLAAELLSTYLPVTVAPTATGVDIEIENRAGHAVPSPLTSGRAVRLVAELRSRNGELIAARVGRITRANRLETMERRSIHLRFAPVELVQAATVVLQLEMARFESDHPVWLQARALFDVPESSRKVQFGTLSVPYEVAERGR